jgi:hypothetical protein
VLAGGGRGDTPSRPGNHQQAGQAQGHRVQLHSCSYVQIDHNFTAHISFVGNNYLSIQMPLKSTEEVATLAE